MIQLPLPLARGGVSDADGFIVGSPNQTAVDLLSRWQDWQGHCCVLVGPPRSGRSTLGRLFADVSGAMVVDDAEQVDERTLFHLWNSTLADKRPLLLVSRHAPAHWAITLPDLRSRLGSALLATIEQPDEDLAENLIETGLARRGIAHAADLSRFLALRLERDYEAIEGALDMLDETSVAQRRLITIASAREILGATGLLT